MLATSIRGGAVPKGRRMNIRRSIHITVSNGEWYPSTIGHTDSGSFGFIPSHMQLVYNWVPCPHRRAGSQVMMIPYARKLTPDGAEVE